MSELKTDYKDDILDETVNTNRTFNVRDNQGNLLYQDVQLEETTVFEQEGDTFGAQQVNESNAKINELDAALDGWHIVVCAEADKGTDEHTLYLCY